MSCAPFNPSIMFKTKDNYEYDTPPTASEQEKEYVIAPNDQIFLRLFPNNGFDLLDMRGQQNQQMQMMNNQRGITYLVEYDGMVNVPILGRVPIACKTLREAEFYLEDLYKKDYVDPYVMLNVVNRRVTIFPGSGGSGMVITLENNNVTLLEALALAGGIAERGKAKKVKLIRGNLDNPKVYLIDLSTIDGIHHGNIIMQANDIIYVEPIGVTLRQVLSEVSPILGFVTSIITLYVVLERF